MALPLNMLKEMSRRETVEKPDESQFQVLLKKYRVALWRLKETCVSGIKMIALSLRSESGQRNMSALEWLSTSIVHDLRNPLGTVYAAAEMLMDLNLAPIQVQRLATNIFCAAGRMRELLADINGLAGGHGPTAEICDVREVISAACDSASRAANNHNVQIMLEVPEGLALPLIRSHMERVFLNLLANSLEAMATGGKLHIAARKATNYVLIELEDTGPGIPYAIRDRLFEPFVTAGKQDGLGLGLALSRQTVRNHGGDIWAEPATGARFVVRLPLNRAVCNGTFVGALCAR
jgi:signal transduction histidine kinase